MVRRLSIASLVFAGLLVASTISLPSKAQAAGRGQPTDWNRFFYYPYVFYPHNFQRPKDSLDHMYYRYRPNQRIPVFNKNWYNFYPTKRPYHRGHHFILDVF